MKKRFRLNRRAVSTVLATVFFLGIAISVTVTLFLMSSTYNNLYQQQLDIREDRLREFISLVKGDYKADNVSNVWYIRNMTLTVKNTGSVTAHVVSVYYNDILVSNSLSNWVAPVETTDTGLIVFLTETKLDYKYDRITVSTDRGTTTTNTWIGLGAYPPGWGNASGVITPYQFQIIAQNPTKPERHGPSQFSLFQRQYFYYVINQTYLSPLEYGVPSRAPDRFWDTPNATSYDPQATVGVHVGWTYAIWMEEFKLIPAGGPGDYTVEAVRWSHYNITITPTPQLHAVNLAIPIGWPTFTYTITVTLGPEEPLGWSDPVWSIVFSGDSPRDIGEEGPYGGSVTFKGGVSNENLVNVVLTLHVYNATTGVEILHKSPWPYRITYEEPTGKGQPNEIVSIGSLGNGGDPVPYTWTIKWNDHGTYRLRVEATGQGADSKTDYGGWSDYFTLVVNP